jgi:ATP-dependent DNA helicase RecQ
VKSTGTNSINKLYIIQNIDRKLSLDDIAKQKVSPDANLKKWSKIVYSGTKLNIIGLMTCLMMIRRDS